MKKSLIALLVATLPAAAFADVTIYGTLKGGIENVDNGTTKKTNVDDLGSRIGFKGSEDLGSGLKAIWQVETGFAIDGGHNGSATDGTYSGSSSGTFANRNSFVGLQSNLGTLRLGNISNYGDSDMGTVDVWQYNSNALGLGIFTRDNTRLKNSVRYDLPAVVPGLTASLQYGAKENKAVGTDDRETSVLGLGYENSGFFGKYSYTHESKVSIANDKHQLEVGYNANNLFVGLGYKQSKGDVSSTHLSALATKTQVAGIQQEIDAAAPLIGNNASLKSTEYALTAAYTLGAFTPKFTYAQGQDIKAGSYKLDNTGYKQFVLGVDYALSKRTTIGAQYGQIKLEDNAAALVNNGEDKIKAFGVNMVHSF
ncbi:porin [Chromobacterium sp. ATCC 53434]|uniref:porin n=1 Tax=Chromobacterium sp. (strain ATCC 53434 / SC 14030) TaxID=2059672 RepID=UPI000C76DFF5|nr:porin [Chromobacterium sp. ATCC 53434]AUH50122.1 porin [Chromobacterium sp. ATCC 53434]